MPLRRRDDPKPRPSLVGERSTDPPERPLKWQVGVALRKYPIQAALAVAIAVLAVPVWLMLGAQADLQAAQTELESATSSLQDVLEDSQESRKTTTRAFCDAINANAAQANRQTDQLRDMILSGAKQSRAFDDLYTSRGLPDYETRLKMARDAVKALDERKIPVLDCDKYLREIEGELSRVPNNPGRPG